MKNKNESVDFQINISEINSNKNKKYVQIEIQNKNNDDENEKVFHVTGKVMINLHSKLFDSIKIKQLEKDEHYMENVLYTNYSDILTSKETNLQSTFSGGAPVFQGDDREAKSALSGFLDKMKQEKDKWLPSNNSKKK